MNGMRILRIVSIGLAGLGGICTVLMMVHIVADVLSRWYFGRPLSGTMEFVSVYYLVPLTFLPLASVQLNNRHIAVDLFVRLLPTKGQAVLQVFTTILIVIFTTLLAWLSFAEAFQSYGIGEVIETAASVMIIWPSRFIVAIGIATMAIVAAVQLLGQLSAQRRRKAGNGGLNSERRPW